MHLVAGPRSYLLPITVLRRRKLVSGLAR
ncbi:UNVERIFIED_CONTAM: hypothetical protein GTU68_037004 [Idotea baltica]|nr:hypothetical protein [Idotea baltica]